MTLVRTGSCSTTFKEIFCGRIFSRGILSGYHWLGVKNLYIFIRVVSQLRLCRPTPSPLRSGHLEIKDAQCANNMRAVKFHITSYRVWAPQAPNAPNRRTKNSTFFKSSQFCRVYWNWSGAHFFHEWLFFVRFLFFEIWSILDFFLAGLSRNLKNFFFGRGASTLRTPRRRLHP